MSAFGANLRSIRKQKNLTQQEVAAHMGITVRAYQYYETGSRTPNLEKASKLAQLFGVSLDELSVRDSTPNGASA